jgi:predicted aspartyl protease
MMPGQILLKRIGYCATIVGLVVATALFAFAEPAQASPCQMGTLETLHLDLRLQAPIVEGSIDGHKLAALLDTGSSISALTRSFAERASLNLRPMNARVYGVGGRSEMFATHVGRLEFGPLRAENIEMAVLGDVKNKGTDAIIGVNVLLSQDLEMALAAGEVRVFLPVGCAKAFLAYWDREASSVPMENVSSTDHRQIITVRVNGTNLRALIDSGAFRTIMDTVTARLVGVTQDSSQIPTLKQTSGIGKRSVDFWVAPIHEVILGRETIKDTKIAVGDIFRGTLEDASVDTLSERNRLRPFDMILGQDFLKSHRVLFSMLQDRFYFSYVGGRVFAVEP